MPCAYISFEGVLSALFAKFRAFLAFFVRFVFACVNFSFSLSLELPLCSEAYFLSLLLRFRFQGEEIPLCSEVLFVLLVEVLL